MLTSVQLQLIYYCEIYIGYWHPPAQLFPKASIIDIRFKKWWWKQILFFVDFFLSSFCLVLFQFLLFPLSRFLLSQIIDSKRRETRPKHDKMYATYAAKNSFARMNFIHKYSSKAINNSETHFELRNPCSLTRKCYLKT